MPPREEWNLGAIIGFVDLVDCVEHHRSKWWDGESYAYVLANPEPLTKPVSCKGQLGFWEIPPDVLRRCKESCRCAHMKPIPSAALTAIERHFHKLVRSRAREGRINCPPLQNLKLGQTTSTSPETPEWFPVPGMYGGFAYWLDPIADRPKLVTESWCRVAEGSGQRHEITEEGAKLVAKGFV